MPSYLEGYDPNHPVRLLFTRAPGFVSWILRRFGKDKTSHVGIMFAPDLVASAESNGTVAQPVQKFMHGRSMVKVFESTPEGRKHLDVRRALVMLGSRYGYSELPGFLIADIKEALGEEGAKNPFHDPHAYVCSEFACLLDDETGFCLEFVDLDPETTSPQELMNRMGKGPTFKESAWRPGRS
jgi:hypothetical protein